MNRTEAAETLRAARDGAVLKSEWDKALTLAIAALEAPAVPDDSVVLTEDDLDDMRRNLGNPKPAPTPAMQAAIDVRSAMVASALEAPAVPDGWKLVPLEPTGHQLSSGIGAHSYDYEPTRGEMADIYRAMVAAAPPVQGDEP